MKKGVRFFVLVLVIATVIGCVAVYAAGRTTVCPHSYSETYSSGKTAVGRTYCDYGSETQRAQVSGKYRVGSDTTLYSYYGPSASGLGVATSTYTYSGSSTVTYTSIYNSYVVMCPVCGKRP